MKKKPKVFIYFFLSLIFLFALFLRTYNLKQNSRFIWDESRALVDMHRIWEQKEITFVGPISEDNLKMFPSLTYYLLLPSTIIGDFDPLSPVTGCVLMGMVVWLAYTFFTKKQSDKIKWLVCSLLIAVFYPFIVTSRWAWNPNPILFWVSLSTIFLFIFNRKFFSWFLAGLFLWLSIYHHYLSIFVVIPATIFIPLISTKKKNLFSFFLGSFMGIIPISLFEIKNHYFLNWLEFSKSADSQLITLEASGYIQRLTASLSSFASMFSLPDWQWVIIFYLILVSIIYLTRKRSAVKYVSLVFVVSMLFSGVITHIFDYYLYALVPFVLYLFINFLFTSKSKLAYLPIFILIILSGIKTTNLITSYPWQGDIQAVRNVTEIVLSDKSDKKTNIAALSSPDPNTKAQRYRDMILINGKILDRFDSYSDSRILYVVSSSPDKQVVRDDPAWEMELFRGDPLTLQQQVSQYPFYLYRFEKD